MTINSLLDLEDLALRIRALGEPGVAFLREALGDADERRLRAILLALTKPRSDDDDISHIIITYLVHKSDLVVAEAIDALRRQEDRGVAVRVCSLINHESPYVRGAVLRYIRRLDIGDPRRILLDSLKDPHFIVRENAVDELEELGDPSLIPMLKPLLLDPHPDVRQAADTAIKYLETLMG
jgi:HEAT repeat protein